MRIDKLPRDELKREYTVHDYIITDDCILSPYPISSAHFLIRPGQSYSEVSFYDCPGGRGRYPYRPNVLRHGSKVIMLHRTP